jgi:glycerol uptake facilitator protein
MMELYKRCLAEFIGTGFLVFFGTAAAVGATIMGVTGLADWLGIALAFALAAMMAIYGIGHVSGAHINPAVSIAMFSIGAMKIKDCLAYVGSQLAGAVVASALVLLTFGSSALTVASLGATLPSSPISAFVVEIIATFALLTTVMAVIDSRNNIGNFGGLAIALTIGGSILSIGTISGGSLNPARTFGPYLIDMLAGGTNYFAYFPIYVFGPIIGAILAVFTYMLLNPAD